MITIVEFKAKEEQCGETVDWPFLLSNLYVM
jgi:hypothetical protein